MAKHILILDTGKEWGGGTNSLIELLKRIDRSKYHFSALFYTNYRKGTDSDIKTELQTLGVRFLIIPQAKQTASIKFLKELARTFFFFSRRMQKNLIFNIDLRNRITDNAKKITEVLTENNIDLLYMNNQPSSNLEGVLASEMTGIPALQHARIEADLNPVEVDASNRVLRKIICVSQGVRNTFIRQGIAPSRCVVVYNGISDRHVPETQPSEIRRQWNIKDNDIVVGTVGSLIKRKRINDLIEAVSIIAGLSDRGIRCFIIGDGPEKGRLSEMIKEKGVEDSVILTGFRPDAVSFTNTMDIFVMTSEKEGLPRVILEAMLMAKPVVASNIQGNSELVSDGVNGFLFPAGDPGKLADALMKLIEHPEQGNTMGKSGRKKVRDSFLIERYVHGVESVFEEVLG